MTFIDTANTCSGCQARDEYIQALEAENQRLDEHSKQWGIKAQQAEADATNLTLQEALDWQKTQNQRIAELEEEVKRLNTQLHVAVGLLSTTPAFEHYHPEEVLQFIIDAAREGE